MSASIWKELFRQNEWWRDEMIVKPEAFQMHIFLKYNSGFQVDIDNSVYASEEFLIVVKNKGTIKHTSYYAWDDVCRVELVDDEYQ